MDNKIKKLFITLLVVTIHQVTKANAHGLKLSSWNILTSNNPAQNRFGNDDFFHKYIFILYRNYFTIKRKLSKTIPGISHSETNNFILSNVRGTNFQQIQFTGENISDDITGKFNFTLDKNGLVTSYNKYYTELIAGRLLPTTDSRNSTGSQKHDYVKLRVEQFFESYTAAHQYHISPSIYQTVKNMEI